MEQKEKTAALITPNRDIAQRVTSICKKWGIDIDDSAGKSLSETSTGSFIILSALCCLHQLKPASLLAFLKHEKASKTNFTNYRQIVRKLDKTLLRGLEPQKGFDGLKQRFKDVLDDPYKSDPDPILLEFITFIEEKMAPLTHALNTTDNDFAELLKIHIKMVEHFCEPSLLWSADDGEAASSFLSSLKDEIADMPSVNGFDYIEILENLMAGVSVRPKYGTHPRLMILGQLEARLIHTDRVIMAGLNEGTWPADNGSDPWMSRPMRQDFGLPTSEKGIGLSAHDFVQGFCAPEVFLTRSKRDNGSPTVPSRWLQRLDVVADALGCKIQNLESSVYKNYLKALHEQKEVNPISRPAPTPPKESRPQKLSVTRIETWLKDPYSIYANKILKLNTLDPLEKEWGPLEKGNILHKITERFVINHKKEITPNALADFISIAKQECDKASQENLWNDWSPRLKNIGQWFIDHEMNWRKNALPTALEIKGSKTFDFVVPFTLEGRADRIDKTHSGDFIFIDYKSGSGFSKIGMINGKTPQLPLEALILEQDGFKTYNLSGTVGGLSYWQMSGGKTSGKVITLDKDDDMQAAKENAYLGLENLVHVFHDDTVPYYSIPRTDLIPTYNDYEHLARIKEWAALDDQEGVA